MARTYFRPGMSSKVYARGDSPTSEGADYAADSDLENPAEQRDGNYTPVFYSYRKNIKKK